MEDFKKDINSNTIIIGDFNQRKIPYYNGDYKHQKWTDLPNKISTNILWMIKTHSKVGIEGAFLNIIKAIYCLLYTSDAADEVY